MALLDFLFEKRNARPKLLPVDEFKNNSNSLDDHLRYIDKVNSIASAQLGIGSFGSDPLELIQTTDKTIFGQAARLEYRGLDIVQRIIDSPAKDALRAGYKIETNFDDLGIGELYEERLKELKADTKFRDYLINSRLYSRGAVMYPVFQETGMIDSREHLGRPIEDFNIEKIKGLNVLPEDLFFYHIQSRDALAESFGEIETINIQGSDIHTSRANVTILGLDIYRQRGVSVLDRILVACKALNIAEWTIANLLLRYRALLLKYPASEIHNQTEKKKAKLTSLIQDIMLKFTSKSVAAVPGNYEFEYLQTTFTGLNEATTFLYEYLSTVSNVPQSIIKGSAKGELASAEKDQRDYYETVKSDEQEAKLVPLIDWLKPFILNEKAGKIYPILMANGLMSEDIELDIIFKPMHSVNPLQDAQIRQIDAQTGAVDIQTGVRDADEVRRDNYPNLDGSAPMLSNELEGGQGMAAAMQSLFDDQGNLSPLASNMFANSEDVKKKYESLVAA